MILQISIILKRNLRESDTTAQWEVREPHFGRNWGLSQLCKTLVRPRCEFNFLKDVNTYCKIGQRWTWAYSKRQLAIQHQATLLSFQKAVQHVGHTNQRRKGWKVSPWSCQWIGQKWEGLIIGLINSLKRDHRHRHYCLPNRHPWGWSKYVCHSGKTCKPVILELS